LETAQSNLIRSLFPAPDWEVIMQQIYELIRHGNFSYKDVMSMPIYQRNHLHDLLIAEVTKQVNNIKGAT